MCIEQQTVNNTHTHKILSKKKNEKKKQKEKFVVLKAICVVSFWKKNPKVYLYEIDDFGILFVQMPSTSIDF